MSEEETPRRPIPRLDGTPLENAHTLLKEHSEAPYWAFGGQHAYNVLHDLVAEIDETHDPVAEIDEARKAVKFYDSTFGTFTTPSAIPEPAVVVYEALKGLLGLVDSAQLPAYDKRDMAKAYREGALSMNQRWRDAEPDWPRNPYTDSGGFND